MTALALSTTKATIIIAAYNEAKVIRQTLGSLSSLLDNDLYQILVICNGCSDATEEIIREEFHNIHCHALANASKALAIRYAESLSPGFPRLYMDADILLTADDAHSLLCMAVELDSQALIIPRSRVTTSGCHPLVKSFYRVWYSTAHVIESGYGAGTYMINQSGRTRFGRWPELIADDAFIRSQFRSDEIHIAPFQCVTVQAPKTLWALIKVKARSKLGNLELKDYLKGGSQAHDNHKTIKPQQTVQQPIEKLRWYDWVIYVLVNGIALGIAKWQFMMGAKTWHRDNSNR